MRLSVIVPVYNVEPYLEACLDSLLRQGLPPSEYEVICVDDGSTDRSGEIAEAYARRCPQLTVLHQANQGVSAARNAGLDAAKGTYLCFVDGDDWAAEGMAAEVLPVMEAGGWDLCAWGMTVVQENLEENTYFGRWREARFSFPTEADRRRFLCRWVLTDRVGWSINCRVFRRSLVESLRFDPDCSMFEDLDFLIRYLACCRNLYYIPKALYTYRQRGSSVMHTSTRRDQAAALLKLIQRWERDWSGQSLFQPCCLYGGTLLAVFLWNLTRTQSPEQALAWLAEVIASSGDWSRFEEQARLAERERAEIRRVCGRRLGGQVSGLYHYILTGDPSVYRRADRLQARFTALRTWKNALLHGREGRT